MHHSPATSSGLKSATGAIFAAPCVLVGIKLIGGSATSVATLHDHPTAASGTVVGKVQSAASASDDLLPPNGIVCNNGLYLTLSGTGAEAIIYFYPSA